jgi:hypothetical protein
MSDGDSPPQFDSVCVEALNPRERRSFLETLPRNARVKRNRLRCTQARAIPKSKETVTCLRSFRQCEVERLSSWLANGPSRPSWLKLMQICWSDLSGKVATQYDSKLNIAENLARPVASHFSARLYNDHRSRINLLLTRSAWISLEQSLLSRLAFTVRFAAQWTWQAFCNTPGLVGRLGRHYSERKLAQLYFERGVEKRTLQLLVTNPALARLWAVQSELWLQANSKFLRDLQQLMDKDSKRDKACRVVALETDRSDWHHGNRSVMRVRFRDQSEWYYKPRSGKGEFLWATAIGAMDKLHKRSSYVPRLIEGDEHCWMKAVSHKPCVQWREAKEFFFRAGFILHLIYRLRGVDFHADNLVAHGSHPVLIDCETLLHPETVSLLRSIRGTGFVPMRDGAKAGVSALGRNAFGSHAVMVGKRRAYPADFTAFIVDKERSENESKNRRKRPKS